jgi:outer membrane receptor protein involved in Fe transport
VGEICLRPNPELSFVQTTRWTVGPATLQLQWRWLDSITKDTVDFGQSSPADYAVPTIASQSYFDLTGAYDVNETWEVRGGITNLFDRDPPIVGTFYGGTAENSGNTFPATYPAIGRSYYVSLTGRF